MFKLCQVGSLQTDSVLRAYVGERGGGQGVT